jgi:hypothetical protein
MRALMFLVAAVMFGLAGGYGWSAMTRPAAKPKHYKATMLIPADTPESASDKEWAARAKDDGPIYAQGAPDPTVVEHSVTYPNCKAAWAAGAAPLYAGQPGYRAEMDGDGDGIACEPIRR